MKIFNKSTILLLVALLVLATLPLLSANAEHSPEIENILWSLNTDTGELTLSGEGPMTNYGVLGGATSPPWYNDTDRILSITVGEGITSLGSFAFFDCKKVTKVTLPQSLRSIGNNAFSNCCALIEVNIPSEVSSLGAAVFTGCGALERVTLPQAITEIPTSTFQRCSRLKTVALPDGVTILRENAFLDCNALTEITLPTGLQTIEDSVFQNCTSLTKLSLPVGVRTVGKKALASCTALKTLSLPNTLTDIGENVLAGASPSKVIFYGTSEEWNAISLGNENSSLSESLTIHPHHSFDQELPDSRYRKSYADCEQPDVYYKSCACGERGEETFTHGQALGHSVGIKATCQEQAVCSVCWKPYGELGAHTPDGEADCTHGVHCSLCHTPLEDALGHDYQDEVTPPTCTEEGYTTHTCSRCEDSYTDTREAPTGHTPGTAATCTADQICTHCGVVLTPRLGHDHRPEVTQEATCTEEGITTHTCSRCGDSYTTPIPPKGHAPGGSATCTQPQGCTRCGAILADKLGHDLVAVIHEPTCDEHGFTHQECSRCHLTLATDILPPKGHTPGEAATCTQPQVCTQCDAILADKLGHDLVAVIHDPTCDEHGFTHQECSRCHLTLATDILPPKGHTPGEAATCTQPQVCTQCGAILADKLGHTYRETLVPPTCIEPGHTLHQCEVCALAYIDTLVPATGHTATGWLTDHHPSFGDPGRHHTECASCGTLLEAETFWPETESLPEASSNPSETPETSSTPAEEESSAGCGRVLSNLLVIVLVLVAIFLYGYIDSRRRRN